MSVCLVSPHGSQAYRQAWLLTALVDLPDDVNHHQLSIPQHGK